LRDDVSKIAWDEVITTGSIYHILLVDNRIYTCTTAVGIADNSMQDTLSGTVAS